MILFTLGDEHTTVFAVFQPVCVYTCLHFARVSTVMAVIVEVSHIYSYVCTRNLKLLYPLLAGSDGLRCRKMCIFSTIRVRRGKTLTSAPQKQTHGVHISSFFLLSRSLTYLMHCLCVTLTSLPGPAPHCESYAEYSPPRGWHDVATRLGPLVGGLRTCGDLLFSGHIAWATMTILLVSISVHVLGTVFFLFVVSLTSGRYINFCFLFFGMILSEIRFG